MTHASRDTTTGLLFEQHTKGQASGIPLHQNALVKYYSEKTGKYYAYTSIRVRDLSEEEKANVEDGSDAQIRLVIRVSPQEISKEDAAKVEETVLQMQEDI